MKLIIEEYMPIVLRTFLIYTVLVIVVKIFARKEVGDFNMQDFVLVLLIAETTQHAMLGDNETLAGGFTSFFTLFTTNKLINWLTYKFPALRRNVERPPAVVIARGEIMKKELKNLKLSIGELSELLREKGILDYSDVKLAVMESDGEFSVIKEKDQ